MRRPELQPLIDHLLEAVQGRDDIRIECAGRIAGGWLASKQRRGEDLIAASLLMLAGRVDLDLKAFLLSAGGLLAVAGSALWRCGRGSHGWTECLPPVITRQPRRCA